MTPPRIGQLERIRRALSDRDWQVLHDLARVRLLTVRQIERLHLGDGSSRTRARRTRSIMQRLHDLDLVTRMERRVGGVHAGSAGNVYALTSKGQQLTTNAGPAGGRRPRRPWEPSLAFTDHVLAVSELYVGLREAEASKRLQELIFEAEPTCWRPWTDVSGARLVVKPDAFVRFAREDYDFSYFVEVDRASQSRNVIRRKGEVYIDYFMSGTEQRRHDVFPQALLVTTDDKRRSQIAEALAKLDAEYWRLFRILLDDEMPHALLDAESAQEVSAIGGSRGA